jgi:hypothetical protein
MVGPVLVIDNSPSAPHTHICGNPKHDPARQWICTQQRCIRVPFQLSCDECRPPAPAIHTPTPRLRYVP